MTARSLCASVAAAAAVAGSSCGGTVHGTFAPPCRLDRAESSPCLETSDGYLVPPSYYTTLQAEENTSGVPHVSGELPSNPNDRRPATRAPRGYVAGPEGVPTRSE